MNIQSLKKVLSLKAQTAVEYLLITGFVVALVLVGFSNYLSRVNKASEQYYNGTVNAILGTPPRCGDGVCNTEVGEKAATCCVDCTEGNTDGCSCGSGQQYCPQ